MKTITKTSSLGSGAQLFNPIFILSCTCTDSLFRTATAASNASIAEPAAICIVASSSRNNWRGFAASSIARRPRAAPWYGERVAAAAQPAAAHASSAAARAAWWIQPAAAQAAHGAAEPAASGAAARRLAARAPSAPSGAAWRVFAAAACKAAPSWNRRRGFATAAIARRTRAAPWYGERVAATSSRVAAAAACAAGRL